MKKFMFTTIKITSKGICPISGIYGFDAKHAKETINCEHFDLFFQDLIVGNDRFAVKTYGTDEIDIFANADVGLEKFIMAEHEIADLIRRHNIQKRKTLVTIR